jgi:hypothetical protein
MKPLGQREDSASPQLPNISQASSQVPFSACTHNPPIQNPCSAGLQWLTPVILATWETGIEEIKVEASPGKEFARFPSPK